MDIKTLSKIGLKGVVKVKEGFLTTSSGKEASNALTAYYKQQGTFKTVDRDSDGYEIKTNTEIVVITEVGVKTLILFKSKSESAVKRIIPDVMKESKPEEAATVDIPEKVTSRVENTAEGKCPSCHEQMRLSSANGIPVHVCMQHSVVMPLRDPEKIDVQ